jgi:hypothetical protein
LEAREKRRSDKKKYNKKIIEREIEIERLLAVCPSLHYTVKTRQTTAAFGLVVVAKGNK